MVKGVGNTIYFPDFILVLKVLEAEGNRMSIISRLTDISYAQLFKTLRDLRLLGIIENNNRMHSLTDKGKALVEHLNAVMDGLGMTYSELFERKKARNERRIQTMLEFKNVNQADI